MSPWIYPGDSGLLWIEGKQDCPVSDQRRKGQGPDLACLLTYTRLNDYGRRGFALRDGQEPAQPHPTVVGQSAAAVGGTDIHLGDPETERGSRNRRDSEGTTKPRFTEATGGVLKKPC